MWIQRELREIQHAEHLPDVTIVVIGLWNMGYTDLKEVARLLWMVDLKPLRRLYKMLKTSKDPLIRRYVDVGLPPGVCRKLPSISGNTINPEVVEYAKKLLDNGLSLDEICRITDLYESTVKAIGSGSRMAAANHSVRCNLCGSRVECVPCPRCNAKGVESESSFEFRKRKPQPVAPPSIRTNARPGSPCKIEAMRERVERGERLFHGKDKKLPTNGELK